MEPFASLFGPVDALLAPYIEYVVLVLVVANIGARAAEYRSIVKAADEGGTEAISRSAARVATNILLVVASFYLVTVQYQAGMVLSMLVVGMVITDLFEFESRLVEARQGIPIERPKGAIAASMLVLAYAAYTALFFLVKGVWSSIV
nr:hypothetical protein [Halomarina sp. BCD28]